MSAEAAKVVFVAIMTIGALLWLWSLQMALAIGRKKVSTDWRLLDEQQVAQADTETGARTVRGSPEALSAALARTLIQHHSGTFGSLFEVVERTPQRLVLKREGAFVCSQPPNLYFSEAELNFDRLGSETTRVTYLLGFDRLARRVKNIALGIILCIGLPALLLVGGAIYFYVLPSQVPGMRWQVLQTLQIGHALWPPFLVMGLYSTGRRQSKTYFSNLLSTLELADGSQ